MSRETLSCFAIKQPTENPKSDRIKFIYRNSFFTALRLSKVVMTLAIHPAKPPECGQLDILRRKLQRVQSVTEGLKVDT
jgi:hypothetical protein